MAEDVDTLFPADQAKDVDSLFPQDVETQRYRRQTLGTSPIQDLIFGDTSVNPVARVLDAFGQGAKQNWGVGGEAISDESAKFLKNAGLFNDYQKGQHSIIKSANEVLMRGAANQLYSAYRLVPAVIGGLQGAAAQIGEETGHPKLGREFAALPEAFPLFGAEIGGTGIPHLPPELAKARELGVIGQGEAGWKGTAPQAEAVAPVAEAEAVKQTAEAQEPLPGQPETAAAPAAAPEPTPAPAPAAPDVHAVARQIAPETFQEYDALTQRKDTFRRWIDDLRESRDQTARESAPHADEIADLQSKLEDTTPRLAKKYQARLEPLIAERDAYVADKTSRDSQDMTKIRERLMETDYAMRDLAPKVSQAYRDAAERMPQAEEVKPVAGEVGPVAEPAVAEPPAEVIAAEAIPEAPKAEAAPETPAVAPAEPVKAEAPPVEQPLPLVRSPSITADVTQKLVAAGRPADEAEASAQLVSAYWQARAERFKGAKGSADAMYAAEGSKIIGQGVRQTPVREAEYAQGVKGNISLLEAGRYLIRLMKKADVTTFIHETGHEWLLRMLQDAKDEAAPEDLKTDANTVLKWLDVDSADALKRRHHEKFARGFETYMMEGRAPSSALASVFAKFKDWLTTIYRTAAALKAPISDDIRGVFDRLLAEKPERTVIAPEIEAKPGMVDAHEALAETTPPEKAHDVANSVEAQVDSHAAQNLVEDNSARLANTSEEAERLAPRGPEPPSDGDAAGSVGGEAGTAAESGTVNAGSGEAAVEGAGAREAKEPVSPTEPYRAPADDLIDKAGNIRLDKLNQPDDIDQVIRDAANRNNQFLTERRNVISDGEALTLADALGKDPAFLDLKKIGSAYNEEEIIAAKRLLIQSSRAVREATTGAKTGDPAGVLAFAEAIARHEMIQGKVSGATAEWGRAGRALRMVMEGADEATATTAFLRDNPLLKDETGRTYNQLVAMAQYGAKLKTPAQMSKFIADTSGGKIKRAIVFYYVNALISGPVTHMRYSVGNAINALWTPLVEIPVSAISGAAREQLGGTVEDRVYLGEAKAQLFGLIKGSRDGYGAAVEAWKTGQSPGLPGEKISAQFLDYVPPIPGPIGTAISVPGKSVAAIHSFFKSLRFEQNIQALAYRKAMKEGLEGEAFAGRIADLTSSPTEEMMESSTKDALKELFMSPNKYHSAMGALTRFTNQSLLAKIVVPFMKIGSQITRNAFIERTPLGLLDQEVRDNLLGKNGGAAFDQQMGKMATGTGLIFASLGMAAEGLMTGDGPEDPSQRAIWMLNHRPNSITIGNMSVPYQGLGHLGMLMRFSANMYETAHAWDGEDGGKLAVAFVQGISKSVLDENFMRGAKDLLDAVYHPDEYGTEYIKNFVTNWLPYSVGMSQTARKIDPYQRETRGENIVDSIFKAARAKIPFVSEGLFPRRDRFGEPIPNGGPLPNYANDRVVQELERIPLGIGKLEHKIRGVTLTDQQYDDYARIAGRMTKMRLNVIVGMPGFSQIPKGIKTELMKSAIDGSRESARDLVLMQNKSIINQANDAKIAKLRGEKPTVH